MGVIDINKGRKFLQKTWDERDAEEWKARLAALAHGERINFTEDEKDFAIAEMEVKFKGDKLNLEEARKWSLVYDLARELKRGCPELYDIRALEPRENIRGGILLLSMPADHTLNERETKIFAQLLYLSQHVQMSAGDAVLTMVFNFPDMWNNSWD